LKTDVAIAQEHQSSFQKEKFLIFFLNHLCACVTFCFLWHQIFREIKTDDETWEYVCFGYTLPLCPTLLVHNGPKTYIRDIGLDVLGTTSIWTFWIFVFIFSTAFAWRTITNIWLVQCNNYVPQWWVELVDEFNWLFTNRLCAARWMKVKRMGITEILRRIWLFSANMIKNLRIF